MAYGHKYTAQFSHGDITYTLNIYQRDLLDWDEPDTIMHVVDLRFGFVSQSTPDEAIVKTQLSLTVVDAPDIHYAGPRKGGNWQEFFTQDPTLYKVEVVESSNQNDQVRWTGYITPDSWSEDLRYHGTITIIARDNLGHLQDFDFKDYFNEDTFSFRDLVARAEILCAQDIEWSDSIQTLRLNYNNATNTAATASALDATFKTEAFLDKTIYDALEVILTLFGLTLRWYDCNTFGICPIGSMTSDTFDSAVTRWNVGFKIINNSGHHTLNPAYKELVDSITYDFDDDNAEPSFVAGPNGAPTTSAAGYMGSENVGDALCLYFNAANTLYLQGTVRIPTSTKLTFKIETLGGYYYKNYAYDVLPANLSYTAAAITARYALIWQCANDVVYYFNQSTHTWQSSLIINSAEASTPDANKTFSSFELTNVTTPATPGKLIVRLYSLTGTAGTTSRYFSCLRAVAVEYQITNKTTKHTVTTVNNPLGNIKLNRTCDVGQYVGVPQVAQCIRNAMLAQDADGLVFGLTGLNRTTDPTDGIRFSTVWEYTHRQLLCAYKDTTSIIEGEIVQESGNRMLFSYEWHYQFSAGLKYFYLCAGQLNVLTNRIEGAVLREIGQYSRMFTEYAMNAYTIVLEDAVSVYDDGTLVAYEEDLYITMANNDSRVKVTGFVATSNPWCQPRLDAYFSRTLLSQSMTLLNYNYSVQGGRYEFEMLITPELCADMEHPGHPEPTDVELGPCAFPDGGEGGSSWTEVPTTGVTSLKIYDYGEY